MIPSEEEMEAISIQREGNLRDIPFPVLLQAYASHKRSLVLELQRHQFRKIIVFENGVPVDAQSNLLHETTGMFLVHKGKMTEEVYQRSLTEASSLSCSFEEVVIQRNLIQPFELFKILQQSLAQKLFDLFGWREGEFKTHTDMPDVSSPLKVNAAQLMLTGIARFLDQDQVNAGVSNLVGKTLVLHPLAKSRVDGIKFNTRQLRVITTLANPKRIDELAMECEFSPDDITRLVYALSLLGISIPEDEFAQAHARWAKEEKAEAEVVAPQSAASPEPPSSLPSLDDATVRALQDDVMKLVLEYRKKDPFELLGLGIDANMESIWKAYLVFAEKYAPWQFSDKRVAPLADKARDIFLEGARAFAKLCNAEQRENLISRRKQPKKKREGVAAANVFAIKTDLLDSDAQFQEGLGFVEKEEFLKAIELFEFASDCDPQNPLYRAHLAYTRFQHDPLQAEHSMTELEEALRIDPDCGIANYFLGELCRLHGKTGEAESYLSKASKLMAPDRRPVVARKLLHAERKS